MAQIKDAMVPYMTRDEIQDLVKKLAREIEADYQGLDVVLICPLKGSVPFAADLMRTLRIAAQIDFVQLSNVPSDRGEYAGVEIVKDIGTSITGKHVLIVEEIIDAGRTLSFLKNRILASGPASLKVITLLDKPSRRVINIKPDYVGKTIEDRYVVGYGLDDDGLGRNYPDIYYLKH